MIACCSGATGPLAVKVIKQLLDAGIKVIAGGGIFTCIERSHTSVGLLAAWRKQHDGWLVIDYEPRSVTCGKVREVSCSILAVSLRLQSKTPLVSSSRSFAPRSGHGTHQGYTFRCLGQAVAYRYSGHTLSVRVWRCSGAVLWIHWYQRVDSWGEKGTINTFCWEFSKQASSLLHFCLVPQACMYTRSCVCHSS